MANIVSDLEEEGIALMSVYINNCFDETQRQALLQVVE